jgi:tellurite resistance protein
LTPQELLMVPAGADALAAAEGLASRLEAAGYAPHVMKMLHGMSGLAMVHVHHEGGEDEVVLVHPGDEASLRGAVMSFQQQPLQGARWRLAAAIAVPPDVAALFDDGPGARLTHRLASTDIVPLSMPLTNAPQAAQAVVGHVEQALDVRLDLDGGRQTLEAIDALVDRLRPAGSLSDDAASPLHVLMGLGLVATETVRRMGPPSRLGHMDDTFHDAERLVDTLGFPAVAFTNGVAMQVARKVPHRYLDGPTESLVALWDAAATKLPAPVAKDEQERLAVELDRALGLAGSLVRFVVDEIREQGEPTGPIAWSLKDGGVSITRLNTDNSDRVMAMFEALIGREPTIEAIACVADAIATNRATGVQRDALVVVVASHGVRRADLTIPYEVAGGAVSFPDQAQWVGEPLAFAYSMARATDAFTPNVSADGITEVRDAYWRSSAQAPRGGPAPSGATGDALLMKLASLAPFGLFLAVALADGDVSDDEKVAFVANLFDHQRTDPLLQEMVAATELLPGERFHLLISEGSLGVRALAAAGAIFAKHPRGAAAREAFDALGRSIASADGVVTKDEQKVLQAVLQVLDRGEAFALQGGDPFVQAGDGELFKGLPSNVVDIASFAPFAAFMMVAGADGKLDPREVNTFLARISMEKDPILRALLHRGDVPIEQRLTHLAKNKDLLLASLMAATLVFQQVRDGHLARNALMSLLGAIASADGEVDPKERRALDELGKVFDGRQRPQQGGSVPWLPSLVIGGLVVAAVAWVLWG